MGYYNNHNRNRNNNHSRNRNNNHRNRNNNRDKWIDINAIYNSLHSAITQRNQAQERQRVLWSYIKRTNSDRSDEMDRIDSEIGNATYKINGIIANLCRYKNRHKAMNIAYDYLEKEINRISKIIDSKEELVRDVENGYRNLISSRGITHSDTTHMRDYIRQKYNQREKLRNWQNYVSRYLV